MTGNVITKYLNHFSCASSSSTSLRGKRRSAVARLEMDVQGLGSNGGEQAESSVSRASGAAVASLNNAAIYWVEYATQCVQVVWVTDKIFHINGKM